ncbi:MAG: glucosamine-6-phosphate deaminase [Lachnospiraceae bacterium]|nr:glucosamine-6-phosphate deaminase [Lachnospiraceae bacterium]
MRIYKAKNETDMSRKAANIISAQIILKPDSVLGLATGSSPVGTYRQLIDWYNKGDLDFSQITAVNLDEYQGLGPDNEQSYAWFMRENLFKHVNIDPTNCYIEDGLAEDPGAECLRYTELIRGLGGIDLQLLGIGPNAHIGFNEPGEALEKDTHLVKLKETTIRANARFFTNEDEVPKYAFTMGIKAIMQARCIVLVANGENKAEALQKCICGTISPEAPASFLQLHNNVFIVADEAALSLVEKTIPIEQSIIL